MSEKLKKHVREIEAFQKTQSASMAFRKAQLIQRQRGERSDLKELHEKRWTKETQERAARLSEGFRGIWDRMTGKYAEIRRQNELEALNGLRRDRAETDSLIFADLEERSLFHRQRNDMRRAQAKAVEGLHRDIAAYVEMSVPRSHAAEHLEERDAPERPNNDGPKRNRGPKLER